MCGLQPSCTGWCPSCYLFQQPLDSRRESLEFIDGSAQARVQRFSQLRVSLLECQRFGNQTNLLAVAGIQAFPEAPLGAAVSSQPLLAGSCGSACLGFRDSICVLLLRPNHDALIAVPIVLGWFLHESRITSHFLRASSFSPLICPSCSTRPVTRIVRVSKTRPPYRS